MSLAVLLPAFVTGLLCADFLPALPWHPLLPVLPAGAWLLLRRRRPAGLLLVGFLLTLGLSLYHLHRAPPRQSARILALAGNRLCSVEGRIVQIASRPDDRLQIDVAMHRVVHNDTAWNARGNMRLFVEEHSHTFLPGDIIAFRSRLRRPYPFGTPGEFDYPRHLATHGIHLTGFVKNTADIVRLRSTGGISLARARVALGHVIDRAVQPDRAPLVRALTIGDKRGLSDGQRRTLARLGLSHLFSISGFHLGLVAMLGYGVARLLYGRFESLLLHAPPRRLLPPLLLPLLWLYLQLTGQGLPTLRAWLAAAVAVWLLWSRRCCRPLQVVLAMAAMILAAMPLALFEPAFQLSFAGVVGILALVPRWSEHLPRLPRPWRSVVQLPLATLAATLATCPLVLWHFHLLAPAGLLANLWAVPLIGFFAVPVGLAGMLLTPLWTAGAAACFRCVGATVDATLALSQRLLACPPLAGKQLYLSPPQVAAAALLVVVLLLPPTRRWWKMAAAGLALALLCCPPPRPAGLTVTALSVGQGDAALVSDRAGRHFLIDGGGLPHSRFEVGERLVAPALGYLGVDRLAAVVLSHDHPDHRNGLLHVLQHFPTDAFWTAMPPEKLWPPLRAVLRQRGIPIRTFAHGWQVVEHQDDRELAVFAPRQDNPRVNDRSLVFYARQGDNGVLLTGDIEEQGTAQLLTALPARPVTLLKLPHHGSRNSGYQQLLDRFAVRQAFASLGRHNRFGFPHPEVLNALQKRRLPLWRTDQNGTLRYSLQDATWRIRYWQNGLFH